MDEKEENVGKEDFCRYINPRFLQSFIPFYDAFANWHLSNSFCCQFLNATSKQISLLFDLFHFNTNFPSHLICWFAYIVMEKSLQVQNGLTSRERIIKSNTSSDI